MISSRITTNVSRRRGLTEESNPPIRVAPSEAAAANEEDSKAAQEAEQLASGKSARDLAREAEEAEHGRTEKFRQNFERIAIIILWTIAIGFLLIGIVWLWHILAPHKWLWLNEGQVRDLQGFLTGGLIIGVLTDHMRKRLK